MSYSPVYENINLPGSVVTVNESYEMPKLPVQTDTNTLSGAPILINNQMSALAIEAQSLEMALKSKPIFLACPYCRHQSLTRINQKCSYSNIACCLLFGGVTWLIFQAARAKDINCYNAEHYCTRCNKLLNSYKAC